MGWMNTVWGTRTAVGVMRLEAAPPFVGAWFQQVGADETVASTSRVMVMSNRRLWMPYVSVEQDGRVLATRRLLRMIRPGRPTAIPRFLYANVDPYGGVVSIGLVDSSYFPCGSSGSGVCLPLCGP